MARPVEDLDGLRRIAMKPPTLRALVGPLLRIASAANLDDLSGSPGNQPGLFGRPRRAVRRLHQRRVAPRRRLGSWGYPPGGDRGCRRQPTRGAPSMTAQIAHRDERLSKVHSVGDPRRRLPAANARPLDRGRSHSIVHGARAITVVTDLLLACCTGASGVLGGAAEPR